MKSIFLIVSLILSSAIFSQERLEQHVKVGTTLMYRIDLKDKSYDMRLFVKDLEPFVFDYEIIDSANAKGTITHTSGGMKNGIVFLNNFSGGNKVADDQTTGLILSNRVYKNLSRSKRRPVTMFLRGLSGEPSNIGFADGDKNFMLRINGKQTTIQQHYARPKIKFNRKFQTTGDDYFTYYQSKTLPLILRKRTAYYIELLDIINQ